MKLTIVAVSEPNIYPQIFRKLVHTCSLVLPVLASLTPSGVDIQLIDESVYLKKPDYNKLKTDLAALSVRTSCANRAYEISDTLRSRGIKTLLGGIHPSALPEESKRHADAVVIGEAEPVWHQVINDFRLGKLKPFYKQDALSDLRKLPVPRRDLLRFPNRALLSLPTLQTGRGCPHNCTFCSVTKLFGGKYRKRAVEEIIQELRMMKAQAPLYSKFLPRRQNQYVFFLDDNLLANEQYAKNLIARMRPLKISWYTQASVLVAKDLELLELARQAGCIMFAVGFESVVQDSLNHVNKTFNKPKFYYDVVDRIHDAGIMVAASFVLGFDKDDTGVFEQTLRFAVESGVDFASFHILTPYPGTPFFNQIMLEGRLLGAYGDWREFDTQHVVFKPKNMKPEDLQEGFNWLWREFTSLRSIRKRAQKTPNPSFFWPINMFHNLLFSSGLVKIKKIYPARAASFQG